MKDTDYISLLKWEIISYKNEVNRLNIKKDKLLARLNKYIKMKQFLIRMRNYSLDIKDDRWIYDKTIKQNKDYKNLIKDRRINESSDNQKISKKFRRKQSLDTSRISKFNIIKKIDEKKGSRRAKRTNSAKEKSPLLGSAIVGEKGMWMAFTIAPIVTLVISLAYVYLRYGKELFPYLLKDMDSEIVVFDDVLTKESATGLSEKVENLLKEHDCPKGMANKAALFVEEIGLTILEQNKKEKKNLLIELSVLFEKEYVLIIERDSGKIFDITDPDQKIEGLSGFILSGLMEMHKEKAYLTTTGYNRNMMRFS